MGWAAGRAGEGFSKVDGIKVSTQKTPCFTPQGLNLMTWLQLLSPAAPQDLHPYIPVCGRSCKMHCVDFRDNLSAARARLAESPAELMCVW